MFAVPALSENYIKARKQLVLFSAILFGTEVAGIKLIPKSNGVAGSMFSLENPDAVSGILFSIIIWLLYRFFLEWFNLDYRRQRTTISRVDMKSAVFIAMFAVSVSLYQQFNDQLLIEHASKKAVLLSLVAPLLVYLLSFLMKGRHAFFVIVISIVTFAFADEPLGIDPVFHLNPFTAFISIFASFVVLTLKQVMIAGLHKSSYSSNLMKKLFLIQDKKSSDAVAKLIQMVTWRLYYYPDDPNKSKLVNFESNGKIKDANENENNWKVSDGILEIYDAAGHIFSRFEFVERSLMLKNTNASDHRSLPDQYMLIEETENVLTQHEIEQIAAHTNPTATNPKIERIKRHIKRSKA